MHDWLDLGNHQEAHDVFIEHLAGLYFGSHEAIQRLKIRSVANNGRGASSQVVVGGERRYVEEILRKLEQASTSISGWRCKGALLLELLQPPRCQHDGGPRGQGRRRLH